MLQVTCLILHKYTKIRFPMELSEGLTSIDTATLPVTAKWGQLLHTSCCTVCTCRSIPSL